MAHSFQSDNDFDIISEQGHGTGLLELEKRVVKEANHKNDKQKKLNTEQDDELRQRCLTCNTPSTLCRARIRMLFASILTQASSRS